jgi:hypothetical protein
MDSQCKLDAKKKENPHRPGAQKPMGANRERGMNE